MKSIFSTILFAIILLSLYLLFWPVPVEPQSWQAPISEGYKGVFEANQDLAEFDTIDIDGLHGPEAIISGDDGYLYAPTHEGWILRWAEGDLSAKKWVNVGGRPLGIAFDGAQNLWVANAYLGLQKVSTNKNVSLELSETEGVEIRYADDLDVTPNGKIYFSDASTKFSAQVIGSTLAASLLDILEHGDHGRIIEYDPSTGQSRVVMRDITFANGVSAAADGSFILVAETGSYKIHKHWLVGSKAGTTDVVVDNLPGFPDNVHRGRDGRFWIGLTTKRAEILDELSAKPFLRSVIQRLPSFMRPNVEPYGHVLAIDANGTVLHSLQDPQGIYPATTGAWETANYLYVSSLTAPIIARYKKSDLGL